MEPRAKWTDERIDDFAMLVRKNDERIDTIQNLLAAHDLQLTEYERERRMRVDQRHATRLAVVTVILGQVLTIATLIVTRVH